MLVMETLWKIQEDNWNIRGFSFSINKVWSGGRESNTRHSAWKADALPAELPPLNSILL